MRVEKNKKGITLIALIITIVILLILSVVTVTEIKDTKLFSKVKYGAKEYKKAQIDEQVEVNELVEKIDDWSRNTDLQIGDYVEYDVSYNDAWYKETNFTKENGWRVINPGYKNIDGTYDGVEIISTVRPVMLYYDPIKFGKSDGKTSYIWKGDEIDIKKLQNNCSYIAKDEKNAGLTMTAGLANTKKFGMIPVVDDKSANGENGKAYRGVIRKKDQEPLRGEKTLRELLVIDEIVDEMKCPTLDIVKDTMNKRKNNDGKKYELGIDSDVLAPNNKFSTKDDAAKGFWDLQYLNIGQLKPGDGGSCWLASPYSIDENRVHCVGWDGDYGVFDWNTGIGNGVRPIICLKNGVTIKKSSFQND